MSLTADQQAAAYASGSVAVTAGAGTGKTHMLAERYLHHLDVHGLAPLEIVAVTYTERAAAELRQRIRERVLEALPTRTDHHAELEAATIGTIHALAARICREHPEAAEVAPDFQVLDEQDGQVWATERLNEAIEQLPDEVFEHVPYAALCAALDAMIKDPILAERALACPRDTWDALAQSERRKALAEMLEDPEWQSNEALIRFTRGADGDAAEFARATAAAAITQMAAHLAQGTLPHDAFTELCGINLRGGRKGAWSGDDLERVKAALKALRDRAKEVRDAKMVFLEVGPKDALLLAALPALAEAFTGVRAHLSAAKRQSRQLDFGDLEVGALRALAQPEVRAYYAERWKAFLVDEFQDTNPVQAEILEHLTGDTRLTVVGDEKQSIYGFRRADVAVFQRFRERIVAGGGATQALKRSYRMHDTLVRTLNTLFAPVLQDLHQDLEAARSEQPHEGPHVRYIAIDGDEKATRKGDRQRAEALRVAREIGKLIDSKTLIYCKKDRVHRAIKPGDIAVLARAWDPLELYGDAFAAAGIPAVHAGGGNLMQTREALDGWALLQFLADPYDNLALAALLRSPFFAVSDRVLFQFVESLTEPRSPWWKALPTSAIDELTRPRQVLDILLAARTLENPTRLLQLAERQCGYTAVLASLPGASRRLADWKGFLSLIRTLERGSQDVFHLSRRLKRLLDAEVDFPRPPLEAGNAIALMTVHAAKGLEWPVVVVPDLTRGAPNETKPVLLDAALGAALRLSDDDGDDTQPVLYQVLRHQLKRREEAERRRVMYVALTRARDHLLLTAAARDGGAFKFLSPGLEAAGVPMEFAPYDAAESVPPELRNPLPPAAPTAVLIEPVGSGLAELPVTALVEYESCPKRFRYRHVEGHPGYFDGGGGTYAARIGTLVHNALEHGVRTPAELLKFDPTLPEQALADAVKLVRDYDEASTFADFRSHTLRHEEPFKLTLGRLTLNGVIDAVGPGYVLDFKTDRHIEPEHHQLQLWVYAHVTGSAQAHLAYLRHGHLHTFEGDALAALHQKALAIAEAIADGHYVPTPSPAACGGCPYVEVCDEQCVTVPKAPESPLLRSIREQLPIAPLDDASWEKALPMLLAAGDPAELWRRVPQAPLNWSAALLTGLGDWLPASPDAAAVCKDLVKAARQCDPAALSALLAPEAGEVREYLLRAPYEACRHSLASVERLLLKGELPPSAWPWLQLWSRLVRWHGRFEVGLADMAAVVEGTEFDILILEE